jgi:hypothetical protein
MKTIVSTTHKNPLLQDIQALNVTAPAEYAGFVYMWRCIPEDKFYIGSHKGKATDDYRGSGKFFKRIFEHYGITQFERVVLEYVANAEDLKRREQFWITKFNAVVSSRFLNEKNALKV